VTHSYPHSWIGGDMKTMQSPNDPIFYFHHGFIDKLYDDWQREDNSRFKEYLGTNHDGSAASMSDMLPFLNAKAKQAMRISSLCYTYQQPEEELRRRTLPLLAELPTTLPDALHEAKAVLHKVFHVNEKVGHKGYKMIKFNKTESICVAKRVQAEIKIPAKRPECWIKLNGYDLRMVRRIEAAFRCIVLKVNRQYRILHGLPVTWRRPSKLRKLVGNKNSTQIVSTLANNVLSNMTQFDNVASLYFADIFGNNTAGNNTTGNNTTGNNTTGNVTDGGSKDSKNDTITTILNSMKNVGYGV